MLRQPAGPPVRAVRHLNSCSIGYESMSREMLDPKTRYSMRRKRKRKRKRKRSRLRGGLLSAAKVETDGYRTMIFIAWSKPLFQGLKASQKQTERGRAIYLRSLI